MKNYLDGFYLIASLLVFLLSIPTPLLAGGMAHREGFDKIQGNVITSRGEQHVFLLELARTEKQQALGLMYRQSLDANAGMLFEFDSPRMVSVWMKNTWLPLDVLFVADAGTIQKIVRDTTPFSLESIMSTSEVLYVLEVNAGTSDRLGIQKGDTLRLFPFE